MAIASLVQLVEVLSRGEFDRLVGTPEGQEFDFKSAPYLMDDPRNQWELAKDVAAFANSGGGCIVVGCQTNRSERDVVDAVSGFSAVPKNLVDVPRYRQVLTQLIYPSPRDLTFRWYPEEDDRGLLLIHIPAAPEADQPLLLRRLLDEGGKRIEGLAVPRRNGDRIEWEPPERIHATIVAARMAQAYMFGAAKEGQRLLAKETADERAAELRDAANVSEKPCVVLQVRAPQGTDFLRHFFGQGGIAEAARAWQTPRPRRGFGIHVDREPKMIGGELLIDSSRHMRVSPDGWFELAAAADYSDLAYRMQKYQRDPARVLLNPVVVVEVVYDYFRFVRQVLAPRATQGTWKGWIRVYGFKGAAVDFPVSDFRWSPMDEDDMLVASDDRLEQAFDLSGDAERDAFEALWRLLMVFGLSRDQVPYSTNERIDPEAIRSIKG